MGALKKSITDTGGGFSLKSYVRHALFGLGGFLLLLCVWELLGEWIFSRPDRVRFKDFLPSAAFKALFLLVSEPVFWDSVLASMRRVLVGLFIAFLTGFLWGISFGIFHWFRRLFNLPLQFVRMVSPLAWMPIAILVLPTFEQAIYFLIVMAAVWPVLYNTSQAIRDIPEDWLHMARIQGATQWQLLTRVLLPHAIPYILSGMRLALGIAWIILVPAEYLGINKGLGYLINDARDTMEYDRLMAVVLAIGILGFLLDSFFLLLRERFDWRQGRS